MSAKLRAKCGARVHPRLGMPSFAISIVAVFVAALIIPAAASATVPQLRAASTEYEKHWDAWAEALDYQLSATGVVHQVCVRAKNATDLKVKARLWMTVEASVDAIMPGMMEVRGSDGFKPRADAVYNARTGLSPLSQADVIEAHDKLLKASFIFHNSANKGVNALSE